VGHPGFAFCDPTVGTGREEPPRSPERLDGCRHRGPYGASMGPLAPALAALALATGAAAGCGGRVPTPLADGCTAGPERIVQALRTAPKPVVLEDGSPLSRCVADGTDDAELQAVGIAFSRAAERLRETAETDPEAALRLGYLVGVTQKGAARTNGVMAELVRRIEVAAGRTSDDASPAAQRALQKGIAAGADVG